MRPSGSGGHRDLRYPVAGPGTMRCVVVDGEKGGTCPGPASGWTAVSDALVLGRLVLAVGDDLLVALASAKPLDAGVARVLVGADPLHDRAAELSAVLGLALGREGAERQQGGGDQQGG